MLLYVCRARHIPTHRWFTLVSAAEPRTMQFKLMTLTSRCVNDTVSHHMCSSVRRVAGGLSVDAYVLLQPINTPIVRLTRLVTVSNRVIPVAAAKHWNKLTDDITVSQSLTVFRRQPSLILQF